MTVNSQYTVVFRGASIKPVGSQKRLFAKNTFNWTESYQVFLTVEYKAGMLCMNPRYQSFKCILLTSTSLFPQCSSNTTEIPIKFGQQSTFEDNDLQPAVPANPKSFTASDPGTSLIIGKVPAGSHASVSCKTGDYWNAIYIDPETHNDMMDKQLTPHNEVSPLSRSRGV